MLETNPFSILAETVSPFAMQGFIIAMIILIALGTIIQMINHNLREVFSGNLNLYNICQFDYNPYLPHERVGQY